MGASAALGMADQQCSAHGRCCVSNCRYCDRLSSTLWLHSASVGTRIWIAGAYDTSRARHSGSVNTSCSSVGTSTSCVSDHDHYAAGIPTGLLLLLCTDDPLH